jgi:DNA repair protein SbcD/Mre11
MSPPLISVLGMRILHTSDWHLGRSFHREGLLDAQAGFVDHLIETVRQQRIDLVVVSGDVYERALPPVDAVSLAHESLRRLAAERVRTVITSGNHDSARRLGFASDLIDGSGVHLRTDPSNVGTPVTVEDGHGPVAVYGLPYLEPDFVREEWGLPERSHRAALAEAMRRVRTDLRRRPPGTRSVVLAHAFVTGATPSDSERDICVGGVANVPADVFNGVDYVALGHLHGRQRLRETVRYSGSPLAYSFSEARQVKGCWLIDLGAAGVDRVEFVPAPVPRRLAVVRGELEALLADPDLLSEEQCWLQVTLTDPIRPRGAMERLRARFPHTLVLGFDPAANSALGPTGARAGVDGVTTRSDVEVASEFVRAVRGAPPCDDEQVLLRRAWEACRVARAAAS